jgi:superfamily II DNA or RNA helicase
MNLSFGLSGTTGDEMKLRGYQTEILAKCGEFMASDATRGQVYSPTGSGKTVIFTELVHKLLNASTTPLRVCVVHPKIALSQEQLRRFKENMGCDHRYTSFHSGKHYQGTTELKEFNTCNFKKLMADWVVSQATSKHHITFSSYDSFGKIAMLEFDLLIFDEAHHLTQKQYAPLLDCLGAKKTLSFTATPIFNYDEDLVGMHALGKFGPVVAAIEPKKLIKKGYMVGPVVHIMRAKSVNGTANASSFDIVGVIADTYVEQRKQMRSYGLPTHQMLVASGGTQDHIDVEQDIKRLWLLIGDQIPVFTIDSKNGERLNGRPLGSRAKALDKIKAAGDCIVIHYDILSEGIDIDTISGILPLRDMSQHKLIQTMGRGSRAYKCDMRDGEVIDLHNRKKPVFIMTVVTMNDDPISLSWKRISDAFVAGGYGDIAEYIPVKEPVTPRGGDENTNSQRADAVTNGQIDEIIEVSLERSVHALIKKMVEKAQARQKLMTA